MTSQPDPAAAAWDEDVWPRHEVTQRHPDGRFTVRYLAGPKQGLLIHFFAGGELDELFAGGYTRVLPPLSRFQARRAGRRWPGRSRPERRGSP